MPVSASFFKEFGSSIRWLCSNPSGRLSDIAPYNLQAMLVPERVNMKMHNNARVERLLIMVFEFNIINPLKFDLDSDTALEVIPQLPEFTKFDSSLYYRDLPFDWILIYRPQTIIS